MAVVLIAGILPAIAMKAVVLKCYENKAVNVRTAEIQNQCTILSNQLAEEADLSRGVTSEIIQAEIKEISNIYNGRVIVIDRDFKIVEDSYDMDSNKMIIADNVLVSYKGKETHHYDAKSRYIEITAPILDNGYQDVKGVLLVSVCTDSIDENIKAMDKDANIVILTMSMLLLVAGFLLGSRIVNPFRRIIKTINAINEGYDDAVLKEDSYEETKNVSEAINQMLGRLRAIDYSRQEFVSNVSHELKTPLTSMKVLSDSLIYQENVPEELYKEFLNDMSQEIERENKIINDLLALVKMDKAANTLNIKPENINALVERILRRLRPIAKTRDIEVVFESFKPVTAEIDETKLSLAISNLVENAIKYNKEQGWVRVTLDANHKFFTLKVSDSGCGIPEEEQKHIFERFYRVDKSHSREIGGTGLGLSITRSAVVVHRGSIKVVSQPGEGTTFTMRIPLNYIA